MLDSILTSTHELVRQDDGGEVASYIPALAEVDPDTFGLAAVTAGGDTYTAGDVDTPFTIQSVSKPFTLALALAECGPEKVFEHVGREPSGDAFNSITLHAETGRPYNPLINSGAIAMAGLIHQTYGSEAYEMIRSAYSKFAGVELEMDEEVYASEMATTDRNRAMAYLMHSSGVLQAPVEESVDLYIRQCSLIVTTRTLATMSATIANIGTNPITGVTVVDPLAVRHVLSLMFTCGMYDYAGRWAVDVGLPAKSGVSGGVMAAVNRQLGIASHSPRLDERGNSVRGIAACVQLAEQLGLHAFEFSNTGSAMLNVYL